MLWRMHEETKGLILKTQLSSPHVSTTLKSIGLLTWVWACSSHPIQNSNKYDYHWEEKLQNLFILTFTSILYIDEKADRRATLNVQEWIWQKHYSSIIPAFHVHTHMPVETEPNLAEDKGKISIDLTGLWIRPINLKYFGCVGHFCPTLVAYPFRTVSLHLKQMVHAFNGWSILKLSRHAVL